MLLCAAEKNASGVDVSSDTETLPQLQTISTARLHEGINQAVKESAGRHRLFPGTEVGVSEADRRTPAVLMDQRRDARGRPLTIDRPRNRVYLNFKCLGGDGRLVPGFAVNVASTVQSAVIGSVV